MMHALTHHKWFVCFIVIFILLVSMTALFNVIIDPMFCFSHINILNERAELIDQRQQKTNLLAFGPRNFSGLVIGSSRTEMIRPKDFSNSNIFNYAAPAMLAGEYAEYIEFFRKNNRGPVESLYLGLDFFATNTKALINNEKPAAYFARTGQSLYRFKTALNFDTLKAYFKKRLDKDNYFQFDRREGVTVFRAGVKHDMGKLLQDRLEIFRKHFYASDRYQYDSGFRKTCETLRDRNSDVRMVVFTTPVSQPLFEELVRAGRFGDYCRWIREIVGVFGGVYNFMYLNSVTINQANFMDADHLLSESATFVAHKISGVSDPRIPADFGVYVTSTNLEQHLADMRRQVDEILARR